MKMDRRTKSVLPENNIGDRSESVSNGKRPKRKKLSDVQFASIIEKINEGFVALDAQMNCLYINKRGSELLKSEPENLIGKNYWDVYPEDKNTSFGQAYLRALETQTPIELEDYYSPGDRWFENRIYPTDGGLSIFFNDVTERKRAEEAMGESEERFETLANGSPVLLWVNGLEGCEFVNREYLDFLGIATETDVRGYDWSSFVHPDDREAYLNAYLRAFEKGSVFSAEFRFRRQDGEYRWMRSEATPRHSLDGSFLGYVGASVDITVRKHAEEKLHLSEERLQIAQKAGNVGVWDWDAATGKTYWSETMWKIHGYEQASSEKVWETSLHTEDRQRVQEGVAQFLDSDKVDYRDEFRIIQPNGSVRWIEAIAQMIRDEAGKPVRMSGVNIDITEAKLNQIALAEFARQQEALYQLADRMQHAKSLEDIFNAALDAILNALQCNRASILLFDKADVMRFVAWRGLSDEYRKATDGHSPWKADEKNPQPISVNDIHTADLSESLRSIINAEGIGSLAFIPLVFNGKLIGKFMAYFNEPHAFTESEMELSLTIAHQLAIGIERKRDENTLRTSEERFRLATQAGQMFSWEFDLQSQTSTVADNFAEVVGFSAGLIPQNKENILQTLIHPEDAQLIFSVLMQAIEDHKDLRFVQFRILNPETSQPVWLEVNGKVVYDSAGKPERMFGVAQNITESKQTEEYIRYLNTELQAQLDEMNTLMEILPTGVWVGNHDCSEITGNPAAYTMLGLEPGMNVSFTNPKPQISTGMRIFVNGTEVDPEDAPMQMAARTGKPLHGFEHELLFPDGSRKAFYTSAIPLFDEDGSIRKVIASYTDFTERKRLEDERTQALHREQVLRESAEQAKLEADQARAEAERELAERKMAEAALGEWADTPLPHETRPAWMRYGMAIAITTLAILLRVVLQPFLGDSFPLATLYGAVAFSVWFGGIGPALFSVIIGYVGTAFFIIDYRQVLTLNAENITGIGLFLLSDAVIIALGQAMRRAQHHAHQSARVAVERQHQVESQLHEKQLVEDSLRQSEALYRGIARSIPGGGIYVVDKDFRYIIVEGPVTEAFGLSRETLEGHKVMEVFPDEQGEKIEDRLRRNFAGENVEFETQFNGRFYWTQMAPLHDSIGQTIILTIDITERKQAEEALKRSEERFARFMQYLPGLAWIKDTDGRYIYANEAAARAFNTRIDELYGKTDEEIFPPEAAAQFRKNDELALMDEKGVQVTETLEHEDGVLHYSLVSKFPIPGPDGSTTLIGGTAFDITERRQAEEALRESESRLRAVFDGTYEYIGLLSPEGTLLEANRAALEFDNNTREEVIGHPFWETPWWVYTPGAQEILRDAIGRAAHGESIRYEAPLNRRSGETIIFDFSLHPIRDGEGEVEFLVPEGRNITERKKAEEALYESEERFRAILRQATAGIVRKDAEGRLIFINQAFCNMLGYTESELLGKTIWDFTHSDDLEENKRLYERTMIEGIPFKLEKRLIRADGSIVWVDVSVSPLLDATGKPQSAVAVEVDITRRKQAEHDLRESEERYRALFNSIDEGFCVIEKVEGEADEPIDFRYIEANPAFAVNAGRDDVIGKTIRQAYPGESDEWFETYDTILRTGESMRFERGLVTQGRVLELYAFRVKDETQARVAVIFKDITERKRAEEELQQLNLQLENRVQKRTSELQAVNQSLLAEIASRQRIEDALQESRRRLQILSQRLVDVQEEERRAIARELHDRVGQSLSALNINLVILDNQISDHVDQPIRSRLDDSMQLVSETIALVRDVMSDLRPPVLDDYGLEAALLSQVNAFKTRYGIDVQFEKPDQPIPRLGASTEMTFLRIAQEALINIARHANADRATLLLWQADQVVHLIVQDNGSGFKSWQDANRPGSHGLTIMRERAEAFGGDLRVSSIPGKGTKVEASIPIGVGGQGNIQKERFE